MKKSYVLLMTIGVASALVATGTIGVLAHENGTDLFAADEPCVHVGNHYAAIAAGEFTPGVKEYYVCCKCGEKFVIDYTDAGTYTLENGTNSTDSRTCPNGLNGTVRWKINGNVLGFWENDCGYVKFANPVTVPSGAKMRLSLNVKADSWYDKTISLYPLSATDWSTNRLDIPVEVSASGENSTIEIPLSGATNFLVDGKLPGFFVSAPLLSWYNASASAAAGNKGCYITVNSVSISSAVPSGTWTDATLPEDIKTAIEADSTDVRYAAPAYVKTSLTGYTLCLGSDTAESRTCPSGLWSSMRAGGLTDTTFGIWGSDCGYIKLATPLTVTTGTRLDISLTIACAGAFSNTVSFYPLGATSWDTKRVDLTANANGTATVSLALTGSPSFLVSGAVPGFFFATPYMSWGATQSPTVDDIAASVTVNSIDLVVPNI